LKIKQLVVVEELRFTGEYELVLTDKNRVVIPAPIRKELAKSEVSLLYISGQSENHLEIFPGSTIAAVSTELDRLGRFHPDVIKYQRLFFSNLLSIKPDQQGRVLLPEQMLAALALPEAKKSASERQLLMLGVADRLELWRKDIWQLHANALQSDWTNLGARLTVLSKQR
jgi:MraZ protein